MPLNVQLGQMLTDLRAHIGASSNPSQMQTYDPLMRSRLRRVQNWLYSEWNWEHLIFYDLHNILAGERYYSFNQSNMNFERIDKAWVQYTTLWRDVGYGITPVEYNQSNPDLGVSSDPIIKWQHYGQIGDDPSIGQFEVWPMPANPQTLKFKGIRKLRPLIADTDCCDLDSDLIVLFTAAEILKQKESKDASDMQQMAQRMFLRLKGQNNKVGAFVLGGGLDRSNRDWPIRIKGS